MTDFCMRLARAAWACSVVLTTARAAGAQSEPVKPRTTVSSNSIAVDYAFTQFLEKGLDPWHLGSLTIGHRDSAGSVFGRLNVASRFGESGTQVEADAYPSLGAHSYGYLNVGYSASSIFPDWRWGAELFRSLPGAYEASLGARQLRFGGPPVTLFTGSVGKYQGNYWFSFRPYVREKPTGTSTSTSLTARRYFADGDDFIGARIGYGTTPADDIIEAELARTSDVTAGVQGSKTLNATTIGTAGLSYERGELPFGTVRNRFELSIGAKYRF